MNGKHYKQNNQFENNNITVCKERKDIDIFISKFQSYDKELKKINIEKKKLIEQLQVKKRCK